MALGTEISVWELKALHDARAPVVVIDVREPAELAIARLDFARHIPMGAIAERLDEIPKDADVVVMCHSGVRSDRVAHFLRECGYASVANLAGGIDSWSAEIDPTVPVY